MPSLNKGFCYPTITDAANSDLSGFTPVSTFLVWPELTSVVGNTATFTIKAKSATTTAATLTNGTLIKTYPVCATVGQVDNNSGITVVDALTVSWLVVLVWAIAFHFRGLRTGVRGY